MSKEPYYTDEEAEEILKLALVRTPAAGGVTRENLLQSAAELGIPYEALAEAEMQVLEKRQEAEDREEFRRLQRNKFKKNSWEFLSVNGALMAINYWTSQQLSWSLAILFFWGIAHLFESFSLVFANSPGYQEAYEKWQRARRKKSKAKPATESELLDRLVLEHENLSKIDAIRLVREETGMDLRDSKEAVDLYLRQRPGAFT